MAITTRLAGTGDLDALVRLEESCFDNPWPLSAFEQELQTPFSRILMALGEDKKTLLGFVNYWVVEDELHLLTIAVDHQRRRQGLGGELLRLAEADGTLRGARIGVLEVRKSNQAAQEMYGNAGYQQVGLRKRYYRNNGEDALVLLRYFEARAETETEEARDGEG